MIALGIVVLVLLIIALLRFGVGAEFGADGFALTAHVGFVPIHLLPVKPKTKPKKEKARKPKKPKKDKKEKEPGKVSDYLAFIPAVKKSLGRLRRRLLIKRLTVHYIAGGDDAYKTAMSFGTANAATALVTPLIESCFRVRRREFKVSADFEAGEPYIYVNAAISLAVWEAIYIAVCLIPPLLKKPKNKTVRKEDEKHGKASDRRTDGNHNAEDTGNGGR